MSTQEVNVVNERTITVIQTRGEKTVQLVVGPEVQNFGQLKQLFRSSGIYYDVKNQIAIEGVRNTSLELDSAILPEGDFKMLIAARKTKAGADRKLLYTRIKEFVHRDGKDAVNEYFKKKAGGKHYTNIPNDKLESLVNNYPTKTTAIEEIEPVETSVQEETSPESKMSVVDLLEKLGVSQETISSVEREISGKTQSDQEWAAQICKQHPLTRC